MHNQLCCLKLAINGLEFAKNILMFSIHVATTIFSKCEHFFVLLHCIKLLFSNASQLALFFMTKLLDKSLDNEFFT